MTALRVTIAHAADPFWNVLLGPDARSVHPRKHTPAAALLGPLVHPQSPPRRRGKEHRALQRRDGPDATLTPDWKEYKITGTVPTAYGPNGLGVKFQMGQQAGVVELAGVTLEDLGPDPAIAAAQAAVLPAATRPASAGIAWLN